MIRWDNHEPTGYSRSRVVTINGYDVNRGPDDDGFIVSSALHSQVGFEREDHRSEFFVRNGPGVAEKRAGNGDEKRDGRVTVRCGNEQRRRATSAGHVEGTREAKHEFMAGSVRIR